MSQASRVAVELTKGEGFLDIWVDANNNGVRDDDDVNIYVSSSGHVFAESPAFKKSLDEHIKRRLEEASLAFMQAGFSNAAAEENICELALELVNKAITETQPAITQWETTPASIPAVALEPAAPLAAPTNEFGIPLWQPKA